ncbi:MAG: hypothetical protein WDO71_21155 [Bacteroidota bacterium]
MTTIKAQNLRVHTSLQKLKGKIDNVRDTVKLAILLIDKTNTPGEDNKASLAGFFKQLEKQPQEFVINNKRDTLISGEDGTALLIPANTFDSNNEVVITLKEFYSYEDIITNKLTTCSDGKQLITGGMIHLIATINGKEVDIQPGKSIRWFVPDTTNSMDQMQLFTGEKERKKQAPVFEDGGEPRGFFNGGDTAADGTLETVNWIAQPQYFSSNYLVTSVKVLDLKNEPLRSRQTKKGSVGTFIISDQPKISREELADELKEKYGYYKVKIKSRKKDTFFRRITSSFALRRRIQSAGDVGDSAWVSDEVAKRYDLQVTETITYTQRGIGYTNGYAVKRTFQNINLNKLKERFSVDIRTLGWINCDRFYLDSRPKIDYYVDLDDTAANYYTLLVFDKLRSMMPGYTNGNKIIFPNVPEGLTAKVISVGIQHGKTVTAMESVQLSKQPLTGLKFEGTSPAAFKEELIGFDK